MDWTKEDYDFISQMVTKPKDTTFSQFNIYPLIGIGMGIILLVTLGKQIKEK